MSFLIKSRLADTSQPIDERIEDIQERDESQQSDEDVLVTLLLVVQEVVCPLSSEVMADVGPDEVCDGERA